MNNIINYKNGGSRFDSTISSITIVPPITVDPPLKKTIIQSSNPQLIYQYKKRLYYESIIKKNKAIIDAPLKPKYSPLYFQTGYNLVYVPAKESIPY
jgi:hypothetical protein